MFYTIAKRAAWAPVLVLVLHSVLSSAFGHEPYVDPAMHALGGAAIALFVWRSAPVAAPSIGALTTLGLALLAFGLACSAAVVWEIGEFAKDSLLGGNVQRGLANTMRDLVCGLSGALAAVTGLMYLGRSSSLDPSRRGCE